MVTVDKPQELKAYVGKELGVSDWVLVDQEMIDKFAEATGDHQWIHVDVERAKRELPIGNTIAHGYLTLSLVPRMAPQIMEITGRTRGINYGSNKVRFTGMVPAEDPQLSVIVVIDEPTATIYGGSAAAPVFADLSRFALSRFRIPPSVPAVAVPVAAPATQG